MWHADPSDEGARLFTICNACRYCEGYCAVFPAMERRIVFTKEDVEYLAHLCHDCGECFDACQYAPPHEFHVDLPGVLAQVRERSYGEHAWPAAKLAITAAAAAAIFAAIWAGAPSGGEVGLYSVIPYGSLAAAFSVVAAFAILGQVPVLRKLFPLANLRAVRDAARLTYLGGARRWFHHATFYGFLLCFASTVSAAFYHHVLGLRAFYGYGSLPVVLGTFGGIGLLIGPAGLLFTRKRRTRARFPAVVAGTSLTGLALLVLRETTIMPLLLFLHLAVVAVFFLMMPYSKFAHGLYRAAALIRYAVERDAGN